VRNGPEVAAFDHLFPWGLLLIRDSESLEVPPDWASDEDQIASARSAIVVRVRHEQEGSARVVIWGGTTNSAGTKVFAGQIAIDSGVLVVGDAIGTRCIRLSVPIGDVPIRVLLQPEREAERVDLVIGEGADSLGLSVVGE
jgi:hypothetical protein